MTFLVFMPLMFHVFMFHVLMLPVLEAFMFPVFALTAFFLSARFPVSAVMLPVVLVIALRALDNHRLRSGGNIYRLRLFGVTNNEGSRRRLASAYIKIQIYIVGESSGAGQQTYCRST